MSRPGRSTHLKTSRPRTATTPKRQSAGRGDNGSSSLDEELQTVLLKEYDEGEIGKKEAIQDVKTVLQEVSQDPMAQVMEKLIPRFLTPTTPQTPGPLQTPKKRQPRSRNTPRHSKLTARPSAQQKTGRLTTEETWSVPNIPKSTNLTDQDMRLTASAPTLQSADTRRSPASYYYADTSSDVQTSERIQLDSEVMPESTPLGVTTEGEDPVLLSTTATAPTQRDNFFMSATVTGEEEEELPYTENLLEMPSDSEETDEIWKSDIVELTKLKSAPKGKLCGGEVLELKYKEPQWPHQPFLNQILARLARLSHLVLDGSELRFLRDLGSSLQSLITLSICDCGLRSLDGAYAFPNLRTLIARKNMIRIPTQCSFLNRLSYLDLSSNPLSSFDEFTNLRHCGELRILKLHDTPLATDPNFNKEMKRRVPQLKEIHPPSLNILKLKQIRKQGQQQMREESKQEANKGSMPSMAYNDVMVDGPKPGIAYQKISSKTKQRLNQQQSEIDDVSLGTGDFTGVFMAPKFLQHLQEAMPPSTAEEESENSASVSSTAANYHEDELFQDEEVEEAETKLFSKGRAEEKKSDGSVQPASSNKNYPGGDGDSWRN